MPTIDLKGKPICIAGASSGIGEATAMACAEAGMPVFLGARREDRLTSITRRITKLGAKAACMPLDVTDPDACREFVASCAEEFGWVYGAFANAGYGEEAGACDMTDNAVRAMFETNFFGTLNVVRPAVEQMKRMNSGHVLICSSCVARIPLPYFSVYSATKAAQHHISRAMNMELRDSKIRVSSVHPVGTKTEFFDVARDRSGDEEYSLIDHTSERFMQTPEKVADAIVKCLRRPRSEVWPSRAARWGIGFAGLMPRTSDLLLRRMVKQRRELDSEGNGGERPAEESPAPEDQAPVSVP